MGSPRSRFPGRMGTCSGRTRSNDIVRTVSAIGRRSIIGLLLIIGTVATVLFVRWRQPLGISTTDLLTRVPKPPPPPVSIAYTVKMPTLWQMKNCPPPGESYLGFRATATEFQSYQRNPTISFLINQGGTIDEVKLLRTSGSSVLDQRILLWLHQLHFAVPKGCELSWRGNGLVNVEF
jgi:hypothetical protein